MNWRCYLGLHEWGDWRIELFIERPKRRFYRECLRCGRRQWR